MPRDHGNIIPMLLITCKQRVGQEDADAIALPLLCWFDAAKRGECLAVGVNHMTTHLIIASYIAAKTKSKRYHEIVTHAYAMLGKAADRPTLRLDLTTAEYAALRKAFSWYLRSLPTVSVGLLNAACKTAEKMMGAS